MRRAALALAAAAVFGVAIAASIAPATAVPADLPLPATKTALDAPTTSFVQPSPASPRLLEREPLGYDIDTVGRLRDAAVGLPALLPSLLDRLERESRVLGITGSVLVALLLAAIAYGLFGQRRFATMVETALGPLTAQLPPAGARWVSGGAQVLAAGALPLGLWGLHRLVLDLVAYRDAAFLMLGTLLLAWTRFAIAAAVVRELVLRPLLPVPAEHGRYLYRIGWWLLVYGVLLAALLEAIALAGAPADVIALARSSFTLSLIVLLTLSLGRKRAVLALFPDVPNRPYQVFLRGFDYAYVPVLALSAGTALIAWAGYQRLAHVLFVRSWALVGLFLAAVLVHQLLRALLRRWILREETAGEARANLYRSSATLLDYLGVVAVVLAALYLTGLDGPIARLLAVRVYTVGDREILLLMLGQAAVIVLAFALGSRLLRDYLSFQVYPALRVEEGLAHAINTFITYAMILLGGLLALQAVGVGFGVLAVFAGAIGVGIGFGLQNFARNLASGLTLVFGRALRKGDWVTVGNTVGVIEEVGIRATRVRTRDAIDYLVPNAEFVDGTIINWTHSSPLARCHVPLGVSYGSDPEEIRRILLDVAAQVPTVQRSPEPVVWFVGFGDSSLDFELLVWINQKQVSEAQARSDLYFAIFAAFKQAGVEIPFPQRDLHLRSVAPGVSGPFGESGKK